MKIGSSLGAPAEPAVSASRNPASPSRADAAPDGAPTLFTLELRLAAAERVLAAQPVADSTRVAALKQAVAEGRYTVNAERLADRLLQDERLRLDSRRALEARRVDAGTSPLAQSYGPLAA